VVHTGTDSFSNSCELLRYKLQVLQALISFWFDGDGHDGTMGDAMSKIDCLIAIAIAIDCGLHRNR
jgi:hypothetical protein